jgi:DNA polymerase-3 subunit alpha
MAGAKVKNIPEEKAKYIFDLMAKFAGYGFNKSHAAAYAVVAYQTAYLKANHPVEFMCAMMTNDMGDTDKLSEYIQEARAAGIEVLPPDVNESQVAFAPVRGGGSIRFGLAAVKGVGEVAVDTMLRAREAGGPFTSLNGFCERLDSRTVNRKVLEALIKSGACDAFGENRATLFAGIDRALGRAASLAHDRERGQASLFGSFDAAAPPPPSVSKPLPEWPQHELLAAEKELLGFYVTGHPLTPLLPLLERFSLATTADLGALANRSMTRIGGMVAAVQSGFSKKTNKPYAMVTLEDLRGSVQVLCMNENYDKYRELLQPNAPLMVVGEVNTGEDKPKIFPTDIFALADAPKRYTKQVHLRLSAAHLTAEKLGAIHALVAQHPGRIPVFLCLRLPAGPLVFIEAHERFGVLPSMDLAQAIDALCGPDTYYAKVDSSLPERPPRRWERRLENGDTGE